MRMEISFRLFEHHQPIDFVRKPSNHGHQKLFDSRAKVFEILSDAKAVAKHDALTSLVRLAFEFSSIRNKLAKYVDDPIVCLPPVGHEMEQHLWKILTARVHFGVRRQRPHAIGSWAQRA
jgi:hypothetical protein